ncbi:putative ribonuclease H-like domain-containing protein, partial [Tanacetum coccineum]
KSRDEISLKRGYCDNRELSRFKKVEGYHAVPPPYTGNYMPSRLDLSFAGLDDSVYKTNVSKTIISVPRNETTASKSSKDRLEQPKDVRPSAPIIEEKSVIEQNTYRQADNLWKSQTVATKSGLVPVNAAKQSSPRAVASISTARHVKLPRSSSLVLMREKKGGKYSYVLSHAGLETSRTRINHISKDSGSYMLKDLDYGNPQYALQDQGIFDSGCSRHMTGKKTEKLDFEDVYFVKEFKFNLFSVSQMCDKKNSVLFTETECLVLSPDFKLLDESQVLLKVLRQNNIYSFDLKNIVPSGDTLAKFDGKADEGFLVGYSINSKAFRVFNTRTRKVEENLHINFLENKPNVAGSGPEWLFDIDSLTKSMNYEPVTAGNQTNGDAGIETNVNAGQAGQEKASDHEYILLPLMLSNSPLSSSSQSIDNKDADEVPGKGDDDLSERNDQERIDSSTKDVNTVGPSINTASENINTGSPNINTASPIPNDSSMQSLVKHCPFDDAYDDREVGAEADLNNLETTMNVSHIPTTRIHKDHPKDQIIGDINSATQTRRMTKISEEHAMVWTLVDLPKGKRAIGTKWVYRNKKDERVIVVRNKAKLVAQGGYTQEEGINYDEVFAPIARIEAIRLFLAYTSFMGFIVYQMDVKSAFLYGIIEEDVYVCQPPGFEDPQFPDKVYNVKKALYGLHQAPRAWYETLSTYLLENGFRRGTIDKTLFIKKDRGLHVQQKGDGIFISQDKYVADILKKFDFVTVKTASTPIETNKALIKDVEAEDVDVHLYRSMIGSLMYLTASRPDIMFAVCACARFQVTPKISHLHAVKRIFRYLKGQPKLGLWYPRDSPFDLEAFSDSDYAGARLDRKSITGVALIKGRMSAMDWRCFLDEIKDRKSSMVGFSEMRQLEVLRLILEEIGYNWYALTKNPTIYVSLIKKFWQTATIKTVDNGEQEINAIVDGKEFTITEASVRMHL